MRITDPQFPIHFDRNTEELEENLLFCIVVAGKKASTQIKLLHVFLNSWNEGTPIEKIRSMDAAGVLSSKLHDSKLGQYTRLLCCFRELVDSGMDLSTCTVDELEDIHGIGPKTARFFLTCNRPGVRHAVIDTHLLKFMNQYLGLQVPSATPGSRSEYTRIEREWLKYVDTTGINPADLDLAIWKIYANRDDSEYRRLVGNSSTAQVAAVA